eukprot:245256_1
MGSLTSFISSNLDEPCSDSGIPFIYLNKSIDPYIQQMIKDECNQANIRMPDELIQECAEFIGFIFYSMILTNTETTKLDSLLLKHHRKERLSSPITRRFITYYDLLFRSTTRDNMIHTLNKALILTAKRKNKHLLICFHTDFNHVLSIYLHKPLLVDRNREYLISNNDRDIALFLVRSQFKTTSVSQCPRLVSFTAKCNYYRREHFLFSSSEMIQLMGLTLYFDRDVHEINLTTICGLETSGNELIGGKMFSAKSGTYSFSMQQVELYQLT